MIDREVVENGLAALSVAAGEMIEDLHDRLVSRLPSAIAERRQLFEQLAQLGADLSAVARAAEVLSRRGE